MGPAAAPQRGYIDARVIQGAPAPAVGGVAGGVGTSGPAGPAASSSGAGSSGGTAAGRQTDELLKKALAQLIASQRPTKKGTSKKGNLTKARRAYAQAKRARNKEITARKKAEQAAAKKKIAAMPKKLRAKARKAFKKRQKEKYDRLKKQMPSASSLGIAEIRTVLHRMRKTRI